MAQGEFCVLTLFDKEHWESIDIWAYPVEERENGRCLKLIIQLGVGKRLAHAERYTDFSYYLNKIIPLLLSLNFLFETLTCKDVD